MANCNCIGTTKKRFQTRRQLLDALVFYVDKDSSYFGSQGYLNFNLPSFDYTGTMINAIYWNGTTISPIGDTTSTRDLIGNSTYIGVSGKDIYLYYNTIRRIQFTGSAGSSNNIGGEYLYIVITTDDVWLVGLGNVQLPITSPSGGWAYTVPTSSAYGYFTNPTYTGSGTLSVYYNQNYVAISNDLKNSEIEIDTDPFAGGGNSDEGGGTGNFDNTSDTIGLPPLPSISVTDTGFMTLFVASTTNLQALSSYLWSNLFSAITPGGTMEETVTTLKKLVANPYDAILGCSIVPFSVPTAGSKDVKMYGVLDSGITLPVASTNYKEIDCGTLNINEYWGAYLDYAPYTKVTSLYLPYIGVVSIDTDMIMGKSLRVVYHADALSGQCIAYIIINGSVEFQYQGHCATNIPITSVDYGNTVMSGLSLVGSIANIVGGGAKGGAVGGAVGAIAGAAQSAGAKLPSMVSDVMNSKPDIKSGSGIGGMGGMMSVQKPFLIIERPRQSLPTRQNHWTGYPLNMTKKLSDLSGYTEVSHVNVDGIVATDAEKREIESLLLGGVYI